MRQITHQTALMTICIAVIAAGGCQSTPTGSTGGRIDPYRSTAADRASTRANISALQEFCDIAAARLVLDLPGIDTSAAAASRPVLELGTINNSTQTPSGDFELMLNRLRGKLLRSDVVRQKFRVVMAQSRMQAEMQRTEATGDAPARYDAEATYLLQGDFHEAARGDRRQFYFQVTITHLASREIVLQDDYDLGQLAESP